MPLLAVNGIDVAYGPIAVVKGASFDVAEAEVVSITGDRGSGKTALLSAISGLVPLRAGDVLYRRRSIAGLAPHAIVRQGIAHCPQGRRLFARMTVRENLELGGYTQRDRWQLRRDIAEACELFPTLGSRMSQVATALSAAEQQMLAVARALVGRPRLLLLDEPSTGMPQPVARQLFDVVGTLAGRGIATVVVEQAGRVGMVGAARRWLMEEGRLRLV
jgi:branched-chain amino acid transport system ATP-binding protein